MGITGQKLEKLATLTRFWRALYVSDCPHPNKAEGIRILDRKKQSKAQANVVVINSPTPAASPGPTAALATILGDEYGSGVHAWLSSVATSTPSSIYKLVSGASHHLSGRRDHFSTFTACRPEKVNGIGGSLYAMGVGSIVMDATLDGGKVERVRLDNVLYVPNIQANLVSVSRLGLRGFTVEFGHRGSVLKEGKPIAHAHLGNGGLYSLNASVVQGASAALATTSPSSSLTVWHHRLSHLSPTALQKLACSGHVKGLSIKENDMSSVCSACHIGKAHRLPFPPSLKRASKRLELVHVDILEIGSSSLSERNYVLTITDDYTRKSWALPIGRKADALGAFEAWLAAVQLETGERLGKLRSDNDGEFTSHRFEDLLSKLGVKHDLTQPYSSQQNGRAERFHRTLVDGTITLLEQSGLPRSFWAEAMRTFIFTKNRSPHAALDNGIPESLWRKSPPDVSFLRPFCCRAWATTPSHLRKKLDSKAITTVMLGYEPGKKSYRLWDDTNKKLIISRDVRFEESNFPFKPVGLQHGEGLASEQRNDASPSVSPLHSGTSGIALTPEAAGLPKIATPNRFESLEIEDPNNESEDELLLAPSPPPAPRRARSQAPPPNLTPPPQPKFEGGRLPTPSTPPQDPFDAGNLTDSPDPLDLLPRALLASISAGPIKFDLPSADPESYREAMNRPESEHWESAAMSEVEKLERLKAWTVIPESEVPAGRKTLGSKFVFRSKTDRAGKISSHKARLVAQGFKQREGEDFKGTFAPVAKFTSIRSLMALAAKDNLYLEQADVDSAFPQADLPDSEVVYLTPPEGIRHRPEFAGKVLKLHKALYGLKQSG